MPSRLRSGLDLEEDLISRLPDALLLEVLARLRCAREAARTGVLSRRWRGLWTGLRDLAFRHVEPESVVAALALVPSEPRLNSLNLYDLGGRALSAAEWLPTLLRAADRLATSEVKVRGLRACEAEIELPCLQHATSILLFCDLGSLKFRLAPTGDFARLDKLLLDGNVDPGVLLPRCPRLRNLSMERVPKAVTDGGAESNSLEELCLGGCTLGRAGVVLSGFPRLRRLTMNGRTLPGVKTVTVESKSLEVLHLWFRHMHEKGVRIHIVAPELEYFDFRSTGTSDFTLSLSTPKLEVFHLDYRCPDYGGRRPGNRKWTLASVSMMTKRLLPRVRELSLVVVFNRKDEPPAQWTFAQEIARLPVTDFSELELNLRTEGHVFGALLLQLLHIRTEIRRLKVDVKTFVLNCSDNCDCDEENGNWRNKQVSLPHLRVVEFDGFRGDDHELDFLRHLFRSAPMLKKMTIKPDYGAKLRNGTWQEFDNIGSGACQKLLSIFAENASVECSFVEKRA